MRIIGLIILILVLLSTSYAQDTSVADLQSQLDAAQAQMEQLEAQLAEERRAIENRLAIEQEALAQLRVRFVQEISAREQTITELRNQLESESADVPAEIAAELEVLRNTIAELESKNRELAGRLDDEAVRTNVLRQNLAAETARVRELLTQTTDASALEALQATIAELESKNRELASRLDDETVRTNVLRSNLAAETARGRELIAQAMDTADTSELTERIAQLTAENLILQEQLGVLNARVDGLTAELVAQSVAVEVSAGRAYTVQQGDSLSSIAFNIYNDASRWTDIAEANDIPFEAAGVLEVGQVLVLPE